MIKQNNSFFQDEIEKVKNISYDSHARKQYYNLEYFGCNLDSNLSWHSMTSKVVQNDNS